MVAEHMVIQVAAAAAADTAAAVEATAAVVAETVAVAAAAAAADVVAEIATSSTYLFHLEEVKPLALRHSRRARGSLTTHPFNLQRGTSVTGKALALSWLATHRASCLVPDLLYSLCRTRASRCSGTGS